MFKIGYILRGRVDSGSVAYRCLKGLEGYIMGASHTYV